jgi:hypothetical protein
MTAPNSPPERVPPGMVELNVEMTQNEGSYKPGPSSPYSLAVFRSNLPETDFSVELVKGSKKVLVTPVEGGTEILVAGRTYFIEKGKSCLIFPREFDSSLGEAS